MARLRKQRTAEDLRRRKGIDSFVKSVGASAVEYGKGRIRDYPQEVIAGWSRAIKKLGGRLPKPEKVSMKQAIEHSANLTPVGEAVGGMSVTPIKALQQLGKSAVKLRNSFLDDIITSNLTPAHKRLNLKAYKKTSDIIPTKKVREIAAIIRRSPEKALEPLRSIKYKMDLGSASGMNIRDRGAKTSSIVLAPKAGKRTLFHEYPHDTSWATRGDRTLQGYLSDLLETSTEIGNQRATKLNSQAQLKRVFYRDQPVERHARDVSDVLSSAPGKISNREYDQVFINEAKKTLQDLKEKAPKIHRKSLKEVAKSYKKEAAFKRYVKEGIQEGRAPGTFNEWFEGIVTNPKSKAAKIGSGIKGDFIHSSSTTKNLSNSGVPGKRKQFTFVEPSTELRHARGAKDLEKVIFPKGAKQITLKELKESGGFINKEPTDKELSALVQKAFDKGVSLIEGGTDWRAVNPKLKRIPYISNLPKYKKGNRTPGIITTKEEFTKNFPGLPMRTDDIIKLIKKLPKSELKKVKIRRKAD